MYALRSSIRVNGMLITKTEEGFVADDGSGVKAVSSLDELFKYLLRYYEGRSPLFAGEESYGCVRVFRHPPAVMPGRR